MTPTVHLLVPPWVDDPARPSGGNTYDLRLRDELHGLGWDVRLVRAEATSLARALAAVPDGELALVDGLIASAAGEAMAAESHRLRPVVLLHMPMAEADTATTQSERRALESAAAVVTVSEWSRDWVAEHHGVSGDRVVVAEPGADRGPLAIRSESGSRLLCVGPVVPDKGQDLLLEALTRLAAASQPPNQWSLTFAGAQRMNPTFLTGMRAAAQAAGIADRITFAGPQTRDELAQLLSDTDLVVSASRRESYGMSLAEALARGIPVLATDVGGVREAIGTAPDGTVPGLLVPSDDPDALAARLESWLTDPDLRTRLRAAATGRRERLPSWPDPAARVAAALHRLA